MTIDSDRLAADTAAFVQVPSVTGDEGPAIDRLGELATALGLDARARTYDLAALRADPGYPGEEVPRDALHGLVVTAPCAGDGPRLCLCGHVDVVTPGTEPWTLGPWSGAIEGGRVHGRGAVDMKGGTVAALHAMAAAQSGGEVVLLAVASEEDGGLGAFAALEDDHAFNGCLIPEPTGGEVVCAQAGSLTFTGIVSGRSAHAAMRLEGESAIDNYVEVHQALAAHERDINRDPVAPMDDLPLPYPVSVGRVSGGEWSSSVPDRLEFEVRVGVRLGEDLEAADAAVRATLAGLPVELELTGGRFASGRTDPSHPFARAALEAFGRDRAVGVPYGADMRHFTAHGIPTVMAGPGNAHLAHAVDEHVEIADLVAVAEGIRRVIGGYHAARG